MCDPVDDLTNSAILSQSRLGGIDLRVRHIFLSLPSPFADNQIVPWAVAMTAMASTAGPKRVPPRERAHPEDQLAVETV